jgi:hypothetical protein
MIRIDVDNKYEEIKNDISKDYKAFTLTPKVYFDKYRKDRVNDVFLGIVEDPLPNSYYTITIYVRDNKSNKSIKGNIYLDKGYAFINEELKFTNKTNKTNKTNEERGIN